MVRAHVHVRGAAELRVEVEVAGERTIALTDQLRALAIGRLTNAAGQLSANERRDVIARLQDLLPRV